jgi:hypothetical protein
VPSLSVLSKRIFPSPSAVFKAPSCIERGVPASALQLLPSCFLPHSKQGISMKIRNLWTIFAGLAAVLAFANLSLAQALPIYPSGRLTLVSNTPVMTSDVVGAATVYWAPYNGGELSLYNGTNWTNYDNVAQKTLTLTSLQSASNVYDIFMFLSGTTPNIGIGPSWATGGGSNTLRGSGAGSTQLTQINGMFLNAYQINLYNGSGYTQVNATLATYLGSIYTTGTGATSVQFKPSGQAGGSNNIVGLWNAYNRVRIQSFETDTSGSYTYSGSSFQPTDYGAGDGTNLNNRISWIDGLQMTSVSTRLKVAASTATLGAGIQIGVRLNAASTPYYVSAMYSPTANLTENLQTFYSEESFTPQLGFSYVQAMEASLSAVTATFFPGGVYTLILDGEY